MCKNKYTVRETEDYKRLADFYDENGLEVTADKEPPGELINNWECVDEDGQLLAAATLLRKEDLFVFEDLAVADGYRNTGIGKHLIEMVKEEAQKKGADVLWGCGKVPEYYTKMGWEIVPREDAPAISLCQNCEDFHVTCFPQIIKYKF